MLNGLLQPNYQTLQAADNFAVSYSQNDWGSGATVSVEITNNGTAAINGWTLEWSFPGNQKITNMWNATYTQSGTAVKVTNQSYNSVIAANGGKVSFGFGISYSGSNLKPTGFTLNGNTSSSPSPTVVTASPTMTATIKPTPSPTPTVTVTPKIVKIMPLGDSITDGYNVAGGYRIKLWKNIKNNGSNVDFVGSMTNGPSDLGDRNHEGHSGWRIDQINANINTWMNSYGPKIVLLHIGTNDVNGNYDLGNAPNRLGTLIDNICAKLPAGGKLYVATIIPLSWASSKVLTYNQNVSSVVQTKANQGKPVYLVDMYKALTTADLADGIHPNLNGYNKMADAWFTAIRKDLN